MSRTKHQQGVFQWNPPPIPKDSVKLQESSPSVVSATECTGLTRRPAADVQQAQAISDLYAIHPMKPQGNIGKGNPRNDPRERGFHRTADDSSEA